MNRAERNLIKELKERERDTQKQWVEGRIRDAKYNKRYKVLKVTGSLPGYLRTERVEREWKEGDEIRAMMKLRCGNMEEGNKYWLENNRKICLFCGKGRDDMEHFIRECEVREWFQSLRNSVEERERRVWSDELDIEKEKVLRRLWKEKERLKKERESEKERKKEGEEKGE